APIHDVNGRIVGVLGIIGPVTQATSHTTSLVMAAARAISNQLQTNLYLEEANHRLTELNTILEAINEGVIAWNNAGKIHHINTRAGKLLHLNPTAILGQRLTDVLPLPAVLTQAIARQQELHNVEVRFELNQRPIRAFVTLRPIFDGAAHPIGYIAMLRPIEHIHQLVHQQVGSQATLTLDDIVARSPAMSAVVRQAHLAARGTAPVLLRGEGGVGKNHLAQAIHKASERANKPFLSINCQAIPHELMVAEFLGYEQDPVHGDRPSKFELASGGTLFLDQIENLSLEMQAALLHVIETGHIMRLGSTHPIPVNVRIIAATSAPLEQAVQDERFLRHLYYRFGVFNIHVPALRERVEDIPLLVERFLGRLAQNVNTAVLAEEETMKVLCRYPWPGNVRELENVLERALHHSQDGQIRVLDLPEWVRNGRIISHTSPTPLPVLSVAEAEREAIIRAGWACAGRVSEMAQQLGIGRTTLWRKMKRLNISPNQFKKTH
ncbi:MAG: PTS-dependent dihydroxyacetone kinase operon transcriptional regulator DhaR, partial [Chloroflexi bacterium]